MGRVWRATDVVLHRDVAIKELVPPPGLTPEERREMRERSLREARAIARLNNINVVRVFDVLRTDADPWIVMEYVPSRSLQDRLASDGPFQPVRAAEIGLGVLNALRAAHRNGVVHRDVKPGNVLIGEDGRVVLTDFGLATVPGDPNVTRTGLVLGSPAYIAPERARDGTAGPAADLWSLGATLYAAVEGASPFARSSAIATLAALATENPPPARNAGPLKPVLNGLLRKDPTHRINADEAERLLLRAAGRKSKLSFPMSPTMRRPGVGRERPAYQAGPPVIPGLPTAAGSAAVVPGPRPPVTPGDPSTPARLPASSEDRPPVTPGRSSASGEGRPPVFTPGKASVGRVPRAAETRLDMPEVRDDQDLSGTDYNAPKSAPAEPPGALAKGTRGTYGAITPGASVQRSVPADRSADEEAATSRQVAAREQTEREAAKQREAAERATAERAEAERATAERAEAERATAERAEAERAATERAEREAEEREAAERAAAERHAADREAELRWADAEAQAEPAVVTTAPSPAAGGPLTGTDSDDADAAAPEASEAPAATTGPGAEAGTPRTGADNKPAVGARAGAHSTSKAARKKGRGRSRGRGIGPAAALAPAAESNDADPTALHAIAATDATAGTNEQAPIDAEQPGKSEAAEPAPETESGAMADSEAAVEEAEPDEARGDAGTVLPMRAETEAERATGAAGGRTRPKVAAARSGERKVTTATLGAGTPTDAASVPPSRSAATTVPESRRTDTRPLDDAAGIFDDAAGIFDDAAGMLDDDAGILDDAAGTAAGTASFTGSSRPAWQPMPVVPPTSDKGLTVLGTTLTRRQTAIGGAILLALLLLLALLVPKAVGSEKPSDRPSGGASAASAPAAHPTTTRSTAQATPSQRPTTTPPSTNPAVGLPAGWYLYKDKTGFSVPVPQGWSVRRQGTEVYFQEPGGQYRLLIVDQTNRPKPDPVKDWETQEAARIDSYRNYHRISIHAVSYWDKAADWEFTRTSESGNAVHTVKRGFITAKDQAYGITWSTSAGDWNANEANLQLIYKGFKPAKS